MISRYLIIGLIVSVIIASVGGYIYAQDKRLEAQQKVIAEQGETIGALETANAGQAAAIREMRDAKTRDDALVANAAEKIDALSTRIQNLDRTTKEALRHAPNLALDSVLPPDAADALCLQWRAASGRSAPDHPGNAAGGIVAREADPAAADCGRWRRMTVRDAVEWNGLLLRHAGLEREDKAALRIWAAHQSAQAGGM